MESAGIEGSTPPSPISTRKTTLEESIKELPTEAWSLCPKLLGCLYRRQGILIGRGEEAVQDGCRDK